MRLEVASIRPSTPTATEPGTLAQWRVGALLQAVAVRDAISGQLFLDIGNSRYPTRIASGQWSGPAAGEHLQVRVLRTSPVLALETFAASDRTDEHGDPGADVLRRYLPRQASPAGMASNLGWIARGNGTATELPHPVQQAAIRLWQAFPEVASLGDANSLEQALRRSGVFLESTLASGERAALAARTDLKALLLQLSRALGEHGARPAAFFTDTSATLTSRAPLPSARGPLTALPAEAATLPLFNAPGQQMSELSRQVEGALARLTTVQLVNALQDTPLRSLLVELPVRHAGRATIAGLRIERDVARNNAEPAGVSWTVEAAVDCGAIGALHARITLTGQRRAPGISPRIEIQLRAASPAVVDAFVARSQALEGELRAAGLEVDRIVCLHGMPAGDTSVRSARLLDIRA